MTAQPRSRPLRGFTLLEVMVSLGILAVALMAVADLNGGAVRMHAYSKRLTVAVELARGKMLDIQQQLRKDGLSDFSKEYHGDFDDEGEPDYKWKAMVIKPEIDVDPTHIVDMISSGLGVAAPGADKNAPGGGMQLPGGLPNPLAPGGPMSGLVDMQVKQMTETIKSSVREIKLTISWKSGAQSESFDVVEHIVVLPNAAAAAAAAAAPITPGAPGGGAGAPLIPQPQLPGNIPLNGGGLPGGVIR